MDEDKKRKTIWLEIPLAIGCAAGLIAFVIWLILAVSSPVSRTLNINPYWAMLVALGGFLILGALFLTINAAQERARDRRLSTTACPQCGVIYGPSFDLALRRGDSTRKFACIVTCAACKARTEFDQRGMPQSQDPGA